MRHRLERLSRGARFLRARGLLILAALLTSAPAAADDSDANPDVDHSVPRLGLQPGEPLVRSATPSVPFGINPAESKDYVLDYHGYLYLPAYIGLHDRPNPSAGQGGMVLHAPPLVPQYLRGFEYTAVLPSPWAQLNFTYGNSMISGTAILAATTLSDAAGFYDPTAQLGIDDAYITVNLSKPIGIPFLVNIGALTGRYGPMGAFDVGKYGTPFIARTNLVGETITTAYSSGKLMFMLEEGFGGQVARPPAGLVPAGWNGFADPNVGASFVGHLHAGLSYAKSLQIGLHYLTAFTQDDQVPSGSIPDGRISVYGADMHLSGRYGHLYGGVSYVQATNSAPIAGVIEVLNARGGPELMAEYLGPNSNGNGTLTNYGFQYDVSLARAIFGKAYTGRSPDLLVSLFGIGTHVTSHDAAYNDVTKLKAGGEVTYNFLPWMGVSERVDEVRLDDSDSAKAFLISTSRLLFHTGWMARDEFALQYSYFSDGSKVYVRTGFPATLDPSANPDSHVLAITGTFWW
jgi:hypothetical protein